jgi:hypothetical protein
MTSFVHTNFPKTHAGADRLESAVGAIGQARRNFSGSRSLATLLLSSVAAAIMVVAFQLMDNVAEGHLLMVWIAMWAVAFASLAIIAGSVRGLAAKFKISMDSWSANIASQRADARLWEAAKNDSRVMADLRSAQTRFETEFDVTLPAIKTAAEQPNLDTAGTLSRVYRHSYL